MYQTKLGGLISASIIAACSICSARPIFAGEECGPATSSEIICDQAANLETIFYQGAGSAFNTKTLIIDNPNLNVGMPEGSKQPILLTANADTGVVDLSLWLKNVGEIKFAHRGEIRVQNNASGSSTIQMDAGSITNLGRPGINDALYSLVNNHDEGTTSRVILNGGSIEFSGSPVYNYFRGAAARSYSTASSSAVAELNGTLIKLDVGSAEEISFKNFAIGVSAWVRYSESSDSLALASMTGGAIDIQIDGNAVESHEAFGLISENMGLGDARTELEAGLIDIRYLSDSLNNHPTKVGLLAKIDNTANSSLSEISVSGGSVTVIGREGIGAHVLTNGTGSAVFKGSGSGTVSASGADATGVRVEATDSSASYEVSLSDSVNISGGSGDGAAIHTKSLSGSSGSITIGAGATVDGSAGQAAILDDAGDTTVTVSGTVLGAVDLGDGTDIFTFRSTGSVSGVVDGGAGTDTLKLGASLDVNNGGNPDTNKYRNFEAFEFVVYRVPVDESDPSKDLTVGVDDIVDITGDITVKTRALLGSGTVAISAGKTMSLDQAADSTFSGQLSGAGNFVKSGAGTLTLTGSHGLSGQVELGEGVLVVDGNLMDADLIVGSSGRLQGSGTVGSTSVSGVLAPGNSPGTLTITGDLTLSANGTLEIDVDGRTYSVVGGAGSYDRTILTDPRAVFTANGTLTPILRGITGAATNTFTPEYGDTFTIVTTANSTGVDGAFTSVTQPSSGLPANARFDVLYTNADVDLVVTPASYATFAQAAVNTANTLSFGRALDAVRPSAGHNPSLPNIAAQPSLFTNLYPLNGAELSAAFVPLAGEVHVFAVDDLRNNVERLASRSYVGGLVAKEETGPLWFDVSAERLSYSRDEVASSYASNARFMWLGGDFEQSADLRYGVALGRSWSDVDANHAGRVSGDTTMLLGYYAAQINSIALGTTLGVGQASFDIQRSAALADGLHTETSSGDARFASFNLDLALEYDLLPTTQGAFLADISWLMVDAGGYVEVGPTDFTSSVREESYQSGAVSIGYELTRNFAPETDQLQREASFEFRLRHEFGRDRRYERQLEMHGANWEVSGQDLSPTAAYVGFGADFDFGNGSSLSAKVFGEGNHDYGSYGAALNFVRRF